MSESLLQSIVQIKLGDLEELRQARETAERRCADLEKKLAETQLSDSQSRLRTLFEAFRYAMPVVQFAVANLFPLTVRGWPWHDLRRLARMLPGIPGASNFPAELAVTLDSFSHVAEKWEVARAEGREKELLAEENSARAAAPELVTRLLGVRTSDLPPLDVPEGLAHPDFKAGPPLSLGTSPGGSERPPGGSPPSTPPNGTTTDDGTE
jgi:hypothetical protein